MLSKKDLKSFLDEKAIEYNQPFFIDEDPISIPHQFEIKEDIEISGFLAATIAWGKRPMILKNANRMMALMSNSPFDFLMSANSDQIEKLSPFVHRTFNGEDFKQFILSLRNIYQNHNGLEGIFNQFQDDHSLQNAIHELKRIFFEIEHLDRTKKHVSDPHKGSAAKRINMFLRWMVRNDNQGVDFGLWKSISPAKLSCPLDVHSGNIARRLGILTRKQNDAKALIELDQSLRELCPTDPVKYDFALFGMGVYDDF
jgi:uncharacterized protein (TIGR02757 family)